LCPFPAQDCRGIGVDNAEYVNRTNFELQKVEPANLHIVYWGVLDRLWSQSIIPSLSFFLPLVLFLPRFLSLSVCLSHSVPPCTHEPVFDSGARALLEADWILHPNAMRRSIRAQSSMTHHCLIRLDCSGSRCSRARATAGATAGPTRSASSIRTCKSGRARPPPFGHYWRTWLGRSRRTCGWVLTPATHQFHTRI